VSPLIATPISIHTLKGKQVHPAFPCHLFPADSFLPSLFFTLYSPTPTSMSSTEAPPSKKLKTIVNKDPLVFVGTYNRFNNLAHAPSGTPSKHGLYCFSLDRKTGDFSRIDISHFNDYPDFYNPAFLRYHPKKNVLYACTESIYEDGEIFAFNVDRKTGFLDPISRQSAGGKSTCYITLDKSLNNMLVTNYWDASLGVLGLNEDGTMLPLKHIKKPKSHSGVVSRNLEEHLASRQAEPHSHAIVLRDVKESDNSVAFVPDLGTDVVHQYEFSTEGELNDLGDVPVQKGGGPRYIEFHPDENKPFAYVVNELTCTVQFFNTISCPLDDGEGTGEFLKGSKIYSTLPADFTLKSTCGRITIDPSGQYVVVSNRGHDSLTFFLIDPKTGELGEPTFVPTRGRTPRHFQFSQDGRYIVVANQDTDNLSVFAFDAKSGDVQFLHMVEGVHSPNFVCIQVPH